VEDKKFTVFLGRYSGGNLLALSDTILYEGVIMDKTIKIIIGVIITLFTIMIAIGLINDGYEEKKGTIEISNIGIHENTLDFPYGMNIHALISSMRETSLLRLMTVYKDKNGDILYQNLNAWTKKDILSHSKYSVIEFPGYTKKEKPYIVELYFFEDQYSNSSSKGLVAYTSLLIEHDV